MTDETRDSCGIESELAERLGVHDVAAGDSVICRSKSETGSPSALDARISAHDGNSTTPTDDRNKSPVPPTIPELACFMHMLPHEIHYTSPEFQQMLFAVIMDVSMKAYNHLVNYVCAFGSDSSTTSQSSVASGNQPDYAAPASPPSYNSTHGRGSSEKTEVDNVTMIERVDQAFETLIELGETEFPPPKENPLFGQQQQAEFDGSAAANTLVLFANAALRRPPTRAVESLMAAAQESAVAHSDVDRHDTAYSPVHDPTGETDLQAGEDGLLAFACACGFVELVRNLIELRRNTRFTSEQQQDCTPLMEACAAGASPTVQVLINANADINAVSATSNSALIYAAAAGNTECVKMLLDTGKCTIEQRNENGHCALMEAASAGHLEIVKILCEAGAKSNFAPLAAEYKESPLTLASYKGHVEIVRYLLGHNKEGYSKEELHTALMESCMDGHDEVARLLLDAKAPVNMDSESFESPLTLACCGGYAELAKMLLDAGAAIEEPNDESYTPLMEAAREGHADVVRVLLEGGASVNAQTEETGETAMTLAACSGHTNVLNVLVEYGGDLELGANTPLMEAAQEGHVPTVTFILTACRNMEKKYSNLKAHINTAFCLAAENGHLDVLEVLYTAGADLNIESEGRTPLMKAAKNGYVDIVKYLIDKGVDFNARSSAGDATALSLACASGHKDVAYCLLKSGADPNIELKDGVTCVLEAARNGFVDVVELMLDHTGVFPRTSAQPQQGSIQPAVGGSNSNVQQNVPSKMVRRKKTVNATVTRPATSATAPPDPTCVHAAVAGSMPLSTTLDLNNSRLSYASLARLYNSKLPPGIEPIHAELPADMSLEEALTSVDTVKKLILSCAAIGHDPTKPLNPAVATSVASSAPPQYMMPADLLPYLWNEIVRERWIQGFDNAAQAGIDPNLLSANIAIDQALSGYMAATGVTPSQFVAGVEGMPPSGQTHVVHPVSHVQPPSMSTASGNYLTSIYEASRKNFTGLPLPTNITMPATTTTPSQTPAVTTSPTSSASTAPVPAAVAQSSSQPQCEPASTVAPPLPATQLPQGSAASIQALYASLFSQSSQAQPQTQASSSTQSIFDLVNYLKENPTVEGKWETIFQQFGIPLPPDSSRKGKKKGHEQLDKEITDSAAFNKLMDMFQDLTRKNNDTSSVLEQQSAVLSETLKVLRPTVTSLPGGMVSNSSNCSSLLQSFPSHQNAPPPPPPTSHRRTHSEGDDVDLTRATAAQRAAFNVDKATDSNNDTPLTLACANGHTEMVNLLVARGSNIEHRDKKGFTPLILAATGGHVGVVEVLIAAGALIEAQSERTKDTALSLACSGGRKEVVDVLLQKGANKEHRNVSDYTPLSLAASGGYVEIVTMLLNAGAEINSRTGSKLGISPLMLAAMNGHVEATRVLLEKGSDINAQIETNRNTALTLACFQGRGEVVRLLLQYNANVEHRAKTGLTPLMEAANGGYVDVGTLLLEHGADPNTAPVPSSRDTALTIAADKGHSKFVELLLNHGALIDARNKKGCTALWLACHGGHLETAQVLMKFKADMDAQDNRKVSPLVIGFRRGHVKVVSFLVDHVKQFPSDQEMQRYMATVNAGVIPTDAAPVPTASSATSGSNAAKKSKQQQPPTDVADLSRTCQECMDIIVKAKNEQAEQANQAAERLLAQLAEEEEQIRSRKEKRQKKKEEKRAKKAKKTDDTKSRSPIVEREDVSTKDETEGESEEDDHSKENVPAPVAEERVPITEATSEKAERVAEPRGTEKEPVQPSGLNSRQKRQNSRRTRNESGVNGVTISTNVAQVPSKPSPVATTAKLSPPDEWVKASKKKNATKSRTGTSVPVVLSMKENQSTDDGPFGGWKDVELSRRRTNTLSVCSSAIARVIGRGGANINAIREATGASIEVEKQGLRREQHDRQIHIRGTTETVKNATNMINGLINDNEASVTDIIRQVLRGNASVTSSSSESSRVGNVVQPETQNVRANPVNLGSILKPTANVGTSSHVQSSSSTTNVWQARLAARQRQQQRDERAVSIGRDSSPVSEGSAVSPAPPSPPPKEISIGLPTTAEMPKPQVQTQLHDHDVQQRQQQQSRPTQRRTPSPPQLTVLPSVVPTRPNIDEKELMKAPGYRPHSLQSTALSQSVPEPRHERISLPPKIPEIPMPENFKSPSPVGIPSGFGAAPAPRISSNGPMSFSLRSLMDDPSAHAQLAKIWNESSGDESSNTKETGWSSQLLLNNSFSSMALGTSAEPLFNSSTPTSLPIRNGATGASNVSSTVSSDWMAGARTEMSSAMYSRGQQRLPTTTASNLMTNQRSFTTTPSIPSTQTDSSVFNQIAVQLMAHHHGSSSTSTAPSASNFYSSYPDASTNMPALLQQQSQQSHLTQAALTQKAYAQAYQSANQEYENLNNLLASYAQQQQREQQQQQTHRGGSDYSSQSFLNPTSFRQSSLNRMGTTYAPPPGFGSTSGVNSSIGANTNIPPPPSNLRMYSMPPPAGQSSTPLNFNLYNNPTSGSGWTNTSGGWGNGWN